MWLCTEDKKLINVDHVQTFELNDTRILASFPSVAGADEYRDHSIMVKRYASREAAAVAYALLMAGLDDLLDIEELSRDETPAP